MKVRQNGSIALIGFKAHGRLRRDTDQGTHELAVCERRVQSWSCRVHMCCRHGSEASEL